MADLAANLFGVRERIAHAATKSGRDPQAITIVAVTKTLPVSRIKEALEAGLSNFGENRVQEAAGKYAPRLPEADFTVGERIGRDGVSLQLIGSLQRNKARQAAQFFDCIQSVDSLELIEMLDRCQSAPRPGERLPVLLQVNVTGEASKSGVVPSGLIALAEAVSASKNLRGIGLMTIARLGAGEGELRDTFGGLRFLLADLRNYSGDWAELSMGMSDDYSIAIEEGATIIRLGRALFGPRAT